MEPRSLPIWGCTCYTFVMYFSGCETTWHWEPRCITIQKSAVLISFAAEAWNNPPNFILLPTVAGSCPAFEYIFFGFKGTFHPRTGYEGPEWEWSYIFTLSLTSALHGGWQSTPRTGCFTPGKDIRCPLYRRLGGSGWVRKTSTLPGFDPRIIRSVASRCSDYAVPAPSLILGWENIVEWGKQRTTSCLSLLRTPEECYGPGLEAVVSRREPWTVSTAVAFVPWLGAEVVECFRASAGRTVGRTRDMQLAV